MLTYAVGDVHGRADLLDALLGRIDAHAASRPRRLVFLGDYVDRGPASAPVLDRVRALQRRETLHVVCLKGNHEDMMLRAARGSGEWDAVWLRNGGDATLSSFGVARVADVPADMLDWLAARQTSFEDGRRCYVHAGLDPTRDRLDQSDRDRLWIREAFLAGDHDFGKLVVHGHTPTRDGRPEIRPHRVNVDTGAVYGGPLTAAIFDGSGDAPIGFLQAGP